MKSPNFAKGKEKEKEKGKKVPSIRTLWHDEEANGGQHDHDGENNGQRSSLSNHSFEIQAKSEEKMEKLIRNYGGA